MEKKLLAGLAVGVMMFGMAVVADATSLAITSDSTWKSFDSAVNGWTTLGFDDSSWRNASEDKMKGWVSGPDPVLDLAIWDNPSGNPVGPSSGPAQAWFRKEIVLTSPVVSATALLAVDDNFDFYINNQLVASNWDNRANSFTYDLAPYLQTGSNIIAIHGADAGGCEWLAFDGSITTADAAPVPEPATMLLLGSGLAGLAGSRLRRKKQ